jgi:hypothetical protein
MNTSTKRPWASVTFWGGIVTMAGMLAPALGFEFGAEDQAATNDFITKAIELAGVGIMLWGRLRAKAEITLR